MTDVRRAAEPESGCPGPVTAARPPRTVLLMIVLVLIFDLTFSKENYGSMRLTVWGTAMGRPMGVAPGRRPGRARAARAGPSASESLSLQVVVLALRALDYYPVLV